MKIPLFPLHTVLCPGIVVPLHIFEERYREMTQRCLDTGEPFGVVLIRDGREVGPRSISTLAGVGAFAEIRRAGRYPDGRYDLLAAGTGRFLIDSVDAGSAAYLVADVTPLDDEVGDEPRAERLAATAIGRFVRYLELMRARDGETADVLDIQVEVEASGSADDDGDDEDDDDDEADAADDLVTDEAIADAIAAAVAEPAADADQEEIEVAAADLVIPDDPTVLSYLLSGIVSIELPRRQGLLEAETTVSRLEGLIRILDREILLLGERLRLFTPDTRVLGGARRS
jgi:Lon protease-like protein